MFIHELRLCPFAGLSDLKVSFSEGLNVVLGPNEAGKSTLVNGLKMTLFMKTQYGKREEVKIQPFLPVTGGDTIETGLIFEAEGKRYTLTKSWGGSRESRLSLPEGGILTDPQAVQDKLQQLMGLREGTYQAVLFAYQSGLGSTIDNLVRDPTPAHDLASILRRAVFETDGVSIETLGQMIQAEHDQYYKRWDTSIGRPEGNRGIENPYKKDVGRILSAYYERELRRKELEEILGFEKQMDELNTQISEASDEEKTLKEFFERNQPLVEDARKRKGLEAGRKLAEQDEKYLRENLRKWPGLEEEIRTRKETASGLKGKMGPLTEELRLAQEWEASKGRLERFAQAEKKKKDLDEAQKILSRMKTIPEEDFRALTELHGKLDRLKTTLKAGKITLSLEARKGFDIRVRKDLEEESAKTLEKGQSLDLSAGGQAQIRHADWDLKVRSGEMDFESLDSTYKITSRDYQALLDRLGIKDYEQGKSIFDAHQEGDRAVRTLAGQLGEVLNGDSYEDLEAFAKKIPREQVHRPVGTIAKELGELDARVQQEEKEIGIKGTQVKDLEKEYVSQDNLLNLVVTKRSELNTQDEALKKLRPLPESTPDPETFIREFEGKEREWKDKWNLLSSLSIKRAELEGKVPQKSREEAEEETKMADRAFEQQEKEGRAIAKISEVFREIRSSMDRQTLDPWIDGIRKLAQPLTGGRYKEVGFSEDKPGKIVRTDGVEFPIDLLSMGTKVGLGLALRLSMAGYFLGGRKGFLILNDPLVDMDPNRQEAAAKVIQAFATEKQVILLTCHPAHADLLKGNRIDLKGMV